MTAHRRWEGDARGHGFADGGALAANVELLAEALAVPDWVAEEPELHLLPHIRGACASPESPWRLRDAALEGSVFVVELEHDDAAPAELRRHVFELVGVFAESSTHVHERATDDGVEFDVVTGLAEGQSRFVPHGHLVRLRVHVR